MHTSLVRHLLFHFTFPPTTEIYTLSLHDALPIFGTFQGIKTRNSSRCHNEKQGCYLQKEMGRPSLFFRRSEEHTSELQSRGHLVCRLLLEKKKTLSDPRPKFHRSH